MVLAIIFVIYAYFARLKYPVSESVFGRVVIISFFIMGIPRRFGSLDYFGRASPIADRSFVVALQDKTTRRQC